MINYIFDGTFEGLLTAIYEAYYRSDFPQKILCGRDIQESLFDDNIQIKTDIVKANKVRTAIEEKISPDSLDKVFHVYLSDFAEAGTWIYNYLRLGWKLGKSVDQHLSDDRVLVIHNTWNKVTRECHKMLGLLRFKQIDVNMYYASMEPDHNILGLISSHFVNRLADQNWIIHDLKRKQAALYNQEEWIITDFEPDLSFRAKEIEQNYQKLWRKYFKNIAIESRVNPKLQRQFMPARYWKHLTEKQLPD